MDMDIMYYDTQGRHRSGTVVSVHPQTGELLVQRADNGRREYVKTTSVLEATA